MNGVPPVPLCALPTPLQPLPRLAAHLGLPTGSLWVKRDDLTGVAAGGNKARKLDHLLADAVARGCDVVVTGGRAQSNHCTATAAAARRRGMDCVAVLVGSPDPDPRGNLLLHHVLGTRLVWVDAADAQTLEAEISRVHVELSQDGRSVAHIPIGGSTPLGCQGYVNAADELLAALPELGRVIVATGSGGTHAGLVAGFGSHAMVLGARVDERPDLADRVVSLASDAAALASRPEPIGSLQLDDSQLGARYGDVTGEALAAVATAAQTEGLLLEPIYTGKAMALLLAAARSGSLDPDRPTVFLHTGGLGGLLGTHRDALALPAQLTAASLR